MESLPSLKLPPPATREVRQWLLDHLADRHGLHGEFSGVRSARRHIGWAVRTLPGVAETIDWANALTAINKTVLDPATINDTLGVLLKYQDDIARVRGAEAARILGEVERELAPGDELVEEGLGRGGIVLGIAQHLPQRLVVLPRATGVVRQLERLAPGHLLHQERGRHRGVCGIRRRSRPFHGRRCPCRERGCRCWGRCR